jgi:flagellar motor protein MotB
VQKGVAIGATSGGLIGGVIGHGGGEGTFEGVVMGAGAGGILGALIGDGMTDDFSAENANLKNRIALLEAENEALKNKPAPAVEEITMEERALFASGSAVLQPEGVQALALLADKLRKDHPGVPINVQGHTDNVPISVSGWKSNWELGSARALAVLHYLIDVQNFAPAELSATTFGEYKPAGPNDTAENRRLNRRAVVVLLK